MDQQFIKISTLEQNDWHFTYRFVKFISFKDFYFYFHSYLPLSNQNSSLKTTITQSTVAYLPLQTSNCYTVAIAKITFSTLHYLHLICFLWTQCDLFENSEIKHLYRMAAQTTFYATEIYLKGEN